MPSWTASVSVPWLTITSGGSGGSISISTVNLNYSVGPNYGATRSTVIAFSSAALPFSFPLTQAAYAGPNPLPFTLPASANRSPTGGTCGGTFFANYWSYPVTIQNTTATPFVVTQFTLSTVGAGPVTFDQAGFVSNWGSATIPAGGSKFLTVCRGLSQTSATVFHTITDQFGNTITSQNVSLLP